jgi:hypothetical protein
VRIYAGIAASTPREAVRAFQRGEMDKGRELAQAVIDAWGHPLTSWLRGE